MEIKIIKAAKPKTRIVCGIVSNKTQLKALGLPSSQMTYLEGKLEGKKSTILKIPDDNRLHIVVIYKPLEDKATSYQLEAVRKLGHNIGAKVRGEKEKEMVLSNAAGVLSKNEMTALLEGVVLGDYRFDRYKTGDKDKGLTKVELIDGNVKAADITALKNTLEGTMLARDLVNEPVITLTAPQLSKEITKAGKTAGYTTKVLKKAEIEKLGMGGLLGVNKGSVDPPTFNILEWKPAKAKNKKPIVLVGKGVVYDTGGNSLKPGTYMPTMKSDMGGAAAVTGTLYAVAKNKLPLHVIGLIPSTDNRIGGNALVPDDVIKISDGSTVEVLNTDAEGRLILADALAYAKQYDPELVIDLATLTGAAAAIVGTFGSAMMGTADGTEKQNLVASGDEVFERLAEMPYWDEYGDLIKSDVADIKNLGGPVGGAMTAGKFLEHFTDYPWIHLDIAGPAFLKKAESYRSVGGSGVGVRMLFNFLSKKAGK